MSIFYHIKSISEAHKFLGIKPPAHTLITIIREWSVVNFDFANTKMTSDLFIVGMKGGTGTLGYGRSTYDYENGTMVFTAPKQALTFDSNIDYTNHRGWTILFHPDLIRKSVLGSEITKFSFFDYAVNEALHISEKEQNILNDFIRHIEIEINQNIDKHSQELIISNLHSILKYCQRFYDRQFFTRTNLNKDYVVHFEKYLEHYFASEKLSNNGIPTVADCGEALNMSGRYLSDLLKIETGRGAKDHIHDFIIEKAKTLLLGSNASISEVAYGLGFEYPQHFAKLFKLKTGLNPTDFRTLN
jgi:AraC family transcriptional regulator, transcriptional activator of pobA